MKLFAFLFALLFATVSFGRGVDHHPPSPAPPAPAPTPTPEPVITHDSHHSRAFAAAILTGLIVYYFTKPESKGTELKIKSQPGDDR